MLVNWSNLREAQFSNIFIQRKRGELSPSLKVIMDSISDKQITFLDLSHNAMGPEGVGSFQNFLSNASYLRHLNVSDCGLSPKGGEMIAEALLKNDDMRLTTFKGTRSRLEDAGLTALAQAFSK